jgi:hypothetical protein
MTFQTPSKRLVSEALIEVSRLPEAAEPDWLKRLEEELS